MNFLIKCFYLNKKSNGQKIKVFNKLFRQFHKNDNMSAEDYFNSAETYAEKEQWDNAIAEYTKAIKLDSLNTKYYRQRSGAYLFIHKNDESLLDCTRAINIEASAANYVYRGITYFYMEQYEKSIDDYTLAIQKEPNAAYYYGRGDCYLRLGDCVNAILDFSKAIDIGSDINEAYYFLRATAYEKMSQYENALKDATKAIELCPCNHVYHAYRAWYYFNLDEYDNALADINKAIDELKAISSENYVLRAKIYAKKNDSDNAILNYGYAIDYAYSIMDVTISKYYTCRGDYYKSLGCDNLAEMDYIKAKEHSLNEDFEQ